jgi:hypothetical protein
LTALAALFDQNLVLASVIDRPVVQHTDVPQLTNSMGLAMLALKTVIIFEYHTRLSAAVPSHCLPSAYCHSLYMPVGLIVSDVIHGR